MTPGSGGRESAAVNILLGSGLGVTSISEELVARLRRAHPGEVLVRLFQGTACVRASFGKERDVTQQAMPFLLTLLTSWREVRFRFPFVTLSGPGDLVVLGQVTLREVLLIEVMADLKRMVTDVLRGNGDGVMRTLGGGKEHAWMWAKLLE